MAANSPDAPAGHSAADPLDALVVGGGPAGTAAAFRARELGLRALVIDFDDILKRIRDYPKDKPILPDFGGSDLSFPAGGDLIQALRFDPIDKDELHRRWKGYYDEFDIPFQLGLELVSMERDGEPWKVVVYDHKKGERDELFARHVVLGPGRGVPRRFDIPGNIDGVAYRLDDPSNYCDGPTIIVGGGTSAAEAVIAISNAKTEAEDNCAVYWSYRGTRMPRVSKALSEQFFEAYMGNGNIRYLPESEPAAVVTTPDKQELISFRVDRKTPSDRPSETVHLEFQKGRCIACIGADIPAQLLGEIGIPMVAGGSRGRKMIAVTPLLESRQEEIYLIGDVLSQSYLETDSFEATPESFRPVKHRGNIKTSLRDGVFVAEVIKQRMDGRRRSEVEVVIEDAEPVKGPSRDPRITTMVGLTGDAGQASTESPADEEEEAAVPSASGGRLVLVTQAGVETDEFDLRGEGATTLGRTDSDIEFPNDTSLSESHASISNRNGAFYLRDDGSRSGTYLRVSTDHPVKVGEGDLIRLGRQILVVRRDGDRDQVEHYGSDGGRIGTHAVSGTMVFGRSGGPNDPDVVLDDEDMTLSRFHMSLGREDGELRLSDFNSRNGTYLKVDSERKLEHTDVIRIGGQQLEFRTHDDAPTKTGSHPVPDVSRIGEPRTAGSSASPAPAEGAAAGEAPAGAPHVTFADQDISGEIDPADTLLEWVENHEVALDYECFAGLCGCDAVQIVAGAEHLNDVDAKEKKTLERRGLEPGPYRLACMTRVSGPVVVKAAG